MPGAVQFEYGWTFETPQGHPGLAKYLGRGVNGLTLGKPPGRTRPPYYASASGHFDGDDPTVRIVARPRSPLFSTYRQGENRITSSMLAVFERIDIDTLRAILAAAIEDADLQLVSFNNQVQAQGFSSVPDARIVADFTYLFETKTSVNALRSAQLKEHLRLLDEASTNYNRLVVLTPDADQPGVVTELKDDRVVWLSFIGLADAVRRVLTEAADSVAERTRYLLGELIQLFSEDGLLEPAQDVLVVAARWAYPAYLDCAAYVCQQGRGFRPGVRNMRMGFYYKGAIQPELALIQWHSESIEISQRKADTLRASHDLPAELSAKLATALERMIALKMVTEGSEAQLFLLSGADDPATERLQASVMNDLGYAWTMGQRYARLSALKALNAPAVTSSLEGL